MKIQQRLLIPAIILLPAFQCRKKCDSYERKFMGIKMEEYFRPYKDGNWWVYRNKAGALKDSVYFKDFSTTFIRENTPCLETEQRKFKLANTHLATGTDISVSYDTRENATTYLLTSSSVRLPWFTYFETEDAIKSFPSTENPGNNLLDSISLNGASYYGILIGKESGTTYYFAKDRGLVGWGTFLDTFNLVNFKIL
jgi:hypothetical protein